VDKSQVDDDEFFEWTANVSHFGWWLRTPTDNGIVSFDTFHSGELDLLGEEGHDDDCWGVRPAMWIDLNVVVIPESSASAVEPSVREQG
jgi:hypothetical protein